MADIQDLSITDASNTGRWPENMAFSAVNDAGRADEGLLARWFNDVNSSVVASGSPNAYTATSNRTISALVNNTIIAFTANFTNTGSATFNLNGLGAKTIKRFAGDALASGDITSGQPVSVIYKSSPDCWYMMNAAAALISAAATIAISQYIDFTEVSIPSAPAADVARLYARDDGAGGTFLAWKDSTNTEMVLKPSTQATMETGTDTTTIVTPGRQKYHPGHPKAWANADSAGGLNASYGITSITRNSTGNYTANLSTSMSSANYCVVGTAEQVTLPNDTKCFMLLSKTASTFTYTITDATAGTVQDWAHHFIVMGDQ